MANTIQITRDGNNVTLTANYSSISKARGVCNSLDFWKVTATSAFWTGHESYLTDMLPKLTNKFGAAFEIIEKSTETPVIIQPEYKQNNRTTRGCEICGSTYGLMSASTGTACPDHYDELS